MEMFKLWTDGKALFKNFTFAGCALILVLVLANCSNGSAVPTQADSPVDPNGGIVNPDGSTPPPATCTVDCEQHQQQSYSGYYYKTNGYQGYESFLYINGQSYYVGSQTSQSVRYILSYLSPGWYTISLAGSMGYETGHYPQYNSSYPVIHIYQTY